MPDGAVWTIALLVVAVVSALTVGLLNLAVCACMRCLTYHKRKPASGHSGGLSSSEEPRYDDAQRVEDMFCRNDAATAAASTAPPVIVQARPMILENVKKEDIACTMRPHESKAHVVGGEYFVPPAAHPS